MRFATLVIALTAAASALLFAVKGSDSGQTVSTVAGDEAAKVARLQAELRRLADEKDAIGRELEGVRAANFDLEAALKIASKSDSLPAASVATPELKNLAKHSSTGRHKAAPVDDKDQKSVDERIAANRYFPYKAYRPYRPYRAFKAFIAGERDTPGSEKFCHHDELDPECLGSAASCVKEPDVDDCAGTEPFCQRHASSPLCIGTEVFCRNTPSGDACVGTAAWCLLHKGSKECLGSRYDCEREPRQEQCLGTIAYCAAQFDARLCPREW